MRILQLLFQVEGADEAKRALDDVDQRIDDVGTSAKETDKHVQATFGTNMKAALGLAATGLAALDLPGRIDKVRDLTSKMADAIDTTGVKSSKVFQQIVFAAGQGGASLEQVVTAFTRMNDNIGGEGKATLAAFEKMGLDFEKIKTLAPEQQLIAIGNAALQLKDPADQVDAFNAVFGRGGAVLLPAFRDGIVQVGQQAPIMSDALIAAGDKSGDALNELQQRFNVLQAEALLPFVTFLTQHVPHGLQVTLFGIASLLRSLESLLLAVLAVGGPGKALALLSTGFSGLVGVFGTVSGAVLSFLSGSATALVTFLTTTLPEALGAVIAFLGPQGMIAVALIALGLIWYKWGDDIKAVVINVYNAVKEWLVDKFTGLVNLIGEKIGAITGFFHDMWDKVVGHSYVPDMVNTIEQEFGRLQAVMVSPTQQALGQVTGLFAAAASSVTASSGQMASAATAMSMAGRSGTYKLSAWAIDPSLSTAQQQAAAVAMGGSLAYDSYHNPYTYIPGVNAAPRATGGDVWGGQPYLVGERGPEVVIPRQSGTVIPNHALGGGTTVVVQIDARESFFDSYAGQQRLADRVGQALANRLRTNGASW